MQDNASTVMTLQALRDIGSELRAIREELQELGRFASSVDAWTRRIQAGQAGGGMSSRFTARARRQCTVSGPTASRRASCPPRDHPVRRASSATW